jgi:hypothetical protein
MAPLSLAREMPSVRWFIRIGAAVALVVPLLVLAQAQPAGAINVVTVTSTTDGGPGSLRAAFDTANSDGDDTEIVLQAGATYDLTRCGPDDDANAVGDLDHTEFGKALTITGHRAVIRQTCAGQRVIDEMGSRCAPDFSICFSLTLRITDLVITGGNVTDDGGAIRAQQNPSSGGANVDLRRSAVIGNRAGGDGGAVSSAGGYVEDSVFQGNTAAGSGGALFSFNGTISTERSTFVSNSAGVDSGAVGAIGAINTNIHDSTFQQNNAGDDGGAVNIAFVSVSGSTFSANTAQQGGAVGALSFTATNSTLTENSAHIAGGGVVASTHNLTHVTVVDNHAPSGANLAAFGASATLNPFGSVVALPQGGGADCASVTTTSQGYNFDSDGSCGFTNPTDQSAAGDPRLHKLQNNGGPTLTRQPQKNSPLVDTIPPADCRVPSDQRGVTRPQGAGCDTGAVEVTRR